MLFLVPFFPQTAFIEILSLKIMKNKKCILCGKKIDEGAKDFCESCYEVLKAKYPRNKFKEVIKCHKKHAKKLSQ